MKMTIDPDSRKDYRLFLTSKEQEGASHGFDPMWLPDFLYDFQKSLVEWSVRKGRAAIFADCGLGKTPMQLVWAENVVRKTNKRVLILTPIAVSHQTVREGAKFGIECNRSDDGKPAGKITITNYEKLHLFSQDDYVAVVADESSILKNFGGQRKAQITEFMRTLSYRLLCTATAAPNDCFELGTSSEALGYLGHHDMLTRFFKEDTKKDYLGWGRKTFRFRGHAQEPFWRWVCSWARAIRKPSDIGGNDTDFILPELRETETMIEESKPRDGMLFSMPARSLGEQREERRNTLNARCKMAAGIAIQHDGSSVLWCHLNDEADMLEKLIPDAVQVSGIMSDERKEERLLGFQSGEIRILVTKPRIGCYGLNWPHCHNVVCFPSHSWEQYYQAVRRCWRFGQKHSVGVTVISSEDEQGVLANLKRKARQADTMFTSLVAHMNDAIHIDRGTEFPETERMPSWL
jgi:superfamily II DNA or RNA helicase